MRTEKHSIILKMEHWGHRKKKIATNEDVQDFQYFLCGSECINYCLHDSICRLWYTVFVNIYKSAFATKPLYTSPISRLSIELIQ